MSDAVLVIAVAGLGAVAGWALRPFLRSFDAEPTSRVPVPELLTAGLFALAAAQHRDWRLLVFLVFLASCVGLALVDLAQYRLPNKLMFPSIALVAALITIGQIAEGEPDAISHALIGALVYTAILFVMHLINPAGMGFGDVKLALLLGVMVGWVAGSRLDAVRAVMIALLIGSALGVVLGVGRMLVMRLGGRFLPDPEEGSAGDGWRHTTFPFGPPLMIGAIVVALYPDTILG